MSIRTTTNGTSGSPAYRFTAGQPDAINLPNAGFQSGLPPFIWITGGGTPANNDPGLIGMDVKLDALCDDSDYGWPIMQANAPWLLGNSIARSRINDAATYARANYGATMDPPILMGVSNGWICVLEYARLFPITAMIGILTVTDASTPYVNDDLGLQQRLVDAMQPEYPGFAYPSPVPSGYDPFRDVSQWLGQGLEGKIQAWYSASDLLYARAQMSFLTQVQAEMHNIGAYGHLGTLDNFAAPVQHIDEAEMVRFVNDIVAAL